MLRHATPNLYARPPSMRRILEANSLQPRAPQQQAVDVMRQAFRRKTDLVLRAPTGTGKSLAALAVARDRPTIIATHSKALQDQLIQHDVPALLRAFPSLKVEVLKGHSAYSCPGHCTASGIPIHGGDHSQCGAVCVRECGCLRARRRATGADVVITNQSLLAASLFWAPGLLPPHPQVIIDEAHRWPDTLRDFLGASIQLDARACKGIPRNRHLDKLPATVLAALEDPPEDDASDGEAANRAGKVLSALRKPLGDHDLQWLDDQHALHRKPRGVAYWKPEGWESTVVCMSATVGRREGLGIDAFHAVASPLREAWGAAPKNYAPASAPPPSDPRWSEYLTTNTKRALSGVRGKALVICTSYREVEALAPLATHAQTRGPAGKAAISAFKAARGRAVLVGTESAGTGLDVPGLDLVLITRIPFPSSGFLSAYKDRWPKAWWLVYAQAAENTLLQYAGRLVRRTTDSGRLVVLDPRIQKYNGRFIKALAAAHGRC